MEEHSDIDPPSPAPLSIVASLRAEMGLTLSAMGARVGLSKSQMHEVERTNSASPVVALAIESLSDGRIDAARLNEVVRLSRHGLHYAPNGGAGS